MYFLKELRLNLYDHVKIDYVKFDDIINLHTLKMVNDLSDNVIYSIATHLLNLKCLTLFRGKMKFPRNYLRLIFKNLTRLTHLSIECNGTSDTDSEFYSNVTIANLQKLEWIAFYGLYDCPEIGVEMLTNINTLEYVDIQLDFDLEVHNIYDFIDSYATRCI